ncbi:dihydrofolate reductase [Streptosporangium sp. NPDC049046]|uniref:dihydrofolate reductase family protein n=1 Tax=Streptosporangium sp. NPDC049046 TaxID=3155031 RepID=UPI003427D0EC
MRKLIFGMNLSLDGYIAAPGDDLGWSVPSDELFQWWSDRVGATGLALYGRRPWETMSSHWPTAGQQPGATPAQIEYARRWRDMPKVVFSSIVTMIFGHEDAPPATPAGRWCSRWCPAGFAVTSVTAARAPDSSTMGTRLITVPGAGSAMACRRRRIR